MKKKELLTQQWILALVWNKEFSLFIDTLPILPYFSFSSPKSFFNRWASLLLFSISYLLHPFLSLSLSLPFSLFLSLSCPWFSCKLTVPVSHLIANDYWLREIKGQNWECAAPLLRSNSLLCDFKSLLWVLAIVLDEKISKLKGEQPNISCRTCTTSLNADGSIDSIVNEYFFS